MKENYELTTGVVFTAGELNTILEALNLLESKHRKASKTWGKLKTGKVTFDEDEKRAIEIIQIKVKRIYPAQKRLAAR